MLTMIALTLLFVLPSAPYKQCDEYNRDSDANKHKKTVARDL
jgi:hypothetical protein